MVAAYSFDLRERVVWQFYYQGQTMREVADVFNVSVGFVHHVVNLYGKYGLVTDPRHPPYHQGSLQSRQTPQLVCQRGR